MGIWPDSLLWESLGDETPPMSKIQDTAIDTIHTISRSTVYTHGPITFAPTYTAVSLIPTTDCAAQTPYGNSTRLSWESLGHETTTPHVQNPGHSYCKGLHYGSGTYFGLGSAVSSSAKGRALFRTLLFSCSRTSLPIHLGSLELEI